MARSGREIHDYSDRDERGTEPHRHAVRRCGGSVVDESELLQKKPEPRDHEAKSHQRKTGAHPFWCLLPRASCGRADTYEDILLPVTQEVAGSNLGAPTTYFFIINELSLTLQRWRP